MSRSNRQSAPQVSFFAFQDIITSVSGILIIIVLLLSTMMDDSPETPPERPTAQPAGQTAGQLADQLAMLQSEITASQDVIKGTASASDPEAVRREIEALNDDIRRILQALESDKPASIQPRSQAEGMLDADKVKLDELLKMLEAAKEKLADAKKQAADVQKEIDRIRNEVFIMPGGTPDAKTPRIVVVDGSGIALHTLGKDAPDARHATADAAAQFEQFIGILNPAADALVFYLKPSGVKLFGELQEKARGRGFQIGYDALAEVALPRFGPKTPSR